MIKQKLPAFLEDNLFNSKLDINSSLETSFINCHKALVQNK